MQGWVMHISVCGLRLAVLPPGAEEEMEEVIKEVRRMRACRPQEA